MVITYVVITDVVITYVVIQAPPSDAPRRAPPALDARCGGEGSVESIDQLSINSAINSSINSAINSSINSAIKPARFRVRSVRRADRPHQSNQHADQSID
jgi:hypothetical protein